MDNLGDILNNKRLSEPPEMRAIKKYVQDNYKSDVTIRVEQQRILILVSSSSLANALYSDTIKLQEAAQTDKKLVIRTV